MAQGNVSLLLLVGGIAEASPGKESLKGGLLALGVALA